MKNGCNTLVISKISEVASIFEQRLEQEQNRGQIIKSSPEHGGYDRMTNSGTFSVNGHYSTLIQTHAVRRASSFHH